jgi:hypothetical protein
MEVDEKIVAEVSAYAKAAAEICKEHGIDPGGAHAGEIMELIAKKSAQTQQQK